MPKNPTPAPTDANVAEQDAAVPSPAFSFVKETGTIERAKKPNPFLDAVRSLVVDSDEGLSFDTPNMKGIENRLDEAAKEVGVTVRRKVTENEDGTFHVFFKATKRIVKRTAEQKAADEAAAAKEEGAKS